MGSECHTLHVLFFPCMAPGHMLPLLDIAKLFAARGVKATILTTPANAPLVRPAIDRANASGRHPTIRLVLIPFPANANLPDGCENFSSVPSPSFMEEFLQTVRELRGPFGRVLGELRPDCVVSDMFFPWTYDAAAELGIPRLVFHGMNFFSLCARDSVLRHDPAASLPPGAQSLVIPGLPHRVEMLTSQVADFKKLGPAFHDVFCHAEEVEPKSYGVIVNSFYELEPEYADHYRKELGMRAWHVGPVSLCNDDTIDKSDRGYDHNGALPTERNACLEWLDSRAPGSVVYVCFGSLCEFSASQLREIALGLEASGHPFVWVVRRGGDQEWAPRGYEERIEGRGMIVRGWAPQILILNHGAVGGFVTHCGWNSSLEGVCAGLPLATWPLFAEQFYNERLIVDVLGIGVPVGAKVYSASAEGRETVGAARIAEVVGRLMDGDDEAAEERRRRARELGQSARLAVAEGGSSHVQVGNLIQELLMERDRNVTIA